MKTDLIMRKHPETYIENLHNELNEFLRETLLYPVWRPANGVIQDKQNDLLRPAVEIKQTDKEYKVKVQLPGIDKENIDVKIDDDFLTVTAEMHEEKEQEEEKEYNERCHTSEFRYGRYQRTISFDSPIMPEESRAKYDNGVLCITLPKKEPEEKKVNHLTIE